MNTKDNGGPAFPAHHFDLAENEHGMTLRDYFAARAMQADIASVSRGHDWIPHAEVFAKSAYVMADAMLKARNEQ